MTFRQIHMGNGNEWMVPKYDGEEAILNISDVFRVLILLEDQEVYDFQDAERLSQQHRHIPTPLITP